MARLRMRLRHELSPRLRRARRCVQSDLRELPVDLFLLSHDEVRESDLVRQLVALDDLLGREDMWEVGVIPGPLVSEVREGDVGRLGRDLRALSERARGLGVALRQRWIGGALSGGRYRVTAHTCLLTASGDRLLWRRSHSDWVVDSRSTAGKPFHPWRSIEWVS